MDYDLVREKLASVMVTIAELQAMLPGGPPRPRLVLVKDGSDQSDLPNSLELSRARGGFPIIWDFSSKEGSAGEALDDGSKANTREEALFYSQEEIAKMPKLKDGHFRKTRDGYWQVRYRRGGYDIQFTSKKKCVVMERFREWAKSVEETEKPVPKPKTKRDIAFAEFAEMYFENVKAVNVKKVTMIMQSRCLRRHIIPAIGAIRVRDLTPMNCQTFLNGLIAKGFGRTAEEAKVLMKEILRAAIGEKLITENPMNFVKIPKHQQVHGKALSKEEIADFIARCETSFYQKQFMLFLYTGIRRGELESVEIGEKFITVANGKCRKGEKQTYRQIPIAPGLRKYLPITKEELTKCAKVLSTVFKKVLPSHQLYDLRHTFTSRCQESGIPKEVVDVWTGHVNRSDMTTAVYTHFSEEFLLKQMEKLDF